MRIPVKALVAAAALWSVCACDAAGVNKTDADLIAAYPHDSHAFTQGLLIDNGELFESTGEYGQSSLRRVDLASGRVLASVALPARYFGEGLALADGKLYQLTWKAGLGFVYDRNTLKQEGQFRYDGEGWGLTWDGRHLILSDGSATLRIVDRDDFAVLATIAVTEAGKPLDKLNELEFIDGQIWANVWYQDRIVQIDPDTGQVTASVDTSRLRAALPKSAKPDVLNGIAWDAQAQKLYLTGKDWPRLFEIALPAGDEPPSPVRRNTH